MNRQHGACDLYALLGVTPSATPSQVRLAYRKRIVVAHRSGVLRLVDHLQELREAYETLRDPERRRDYDASGSSDPSVPSGSAELDTREQREVRVLEEVRRDITRHSLRLGAEARAQNAEIVRSIGAEHDKRVLDEMAARARRARTRRMVGILCWVFLVAVGTSTLAFGSRGCSSSSSRG